MFLVQNNSVNIYGDTSILRIFLIFNLVIRINYSLLLQLKLEFPHLPTTPFFSKVKFSLNALLTFIFPLSLMVFIYLSLVEKFVDFYAIISLNGLILLLFLVIFTQVRRASFRHYQMKTARFFKFFSIIFFGVTLFCYFTDLFIFYHVGKESNADFQQAVQTNFFFRSLRRNAIATKTDWWGGGRLPARLTVRNESLKAVSVLVTSILLRHWTKFSKPAKGVAGHQQNINRHLLITVIYLLFFAFFSINVAYFISFKYSFQPIKEMPILLICVLLVILNVLIRRFYAIGNKFYFTHIVSQEIVIFKSVFTTNLKTKPFKNTHIGDDFWNEKYILLKENYRKSFFRYLKNKLLQKLFLYFKVYFAFFCVYFLIEVNGVCAFGLDVLDPRMLAIEMVIFGLSVALIQLISLAQSARDKESRKVEEELLEMELGFARLLIKCNETIIQIIKKNSADGYAETLDELDAELSAFLRKKFDMVLKTYRLEMYKKLKANKIVLNMETQVYDLNYSKLFVSKKVLGNSTFRGQIELKLLKEKEEEENQAKIESQLPQFNSFDNQKKVEKLTDLSRCGEDDTDGFSRPRGSVVHPDAEDDFEYDQSQAFEGFKTTELAFVAYRASKRTQSLPRETIAEWDRIERKIAEESRMNAEKEKQNEFLSEVRKVINLEPQILYQDVRDILKSGPYVRLKLNETLQRKLRYWPQTNFLALLAILYFSLFDLVKNSIVNVLLLSITTNINIFTLVSIVFMYGIPILKPIKFTTTFAVVTFSFWTRVGLSIYPSILPATPLVSIFTATHFSLSAFFVELLTISSTLFLFIPTFLLMNVVFENFVRIKANHDTGSHSAEKGITTSQIDLFDEEEVARPFVVNKLVKTKCFEINYFEWNNRIYRWLPSFHELIIENERFIYPVVFAILALLDQVYVPYFVAYLGFQLFKSLVSKDKFKRISQFSGVSFKRLMGLKLLVFIFLFGIVALSIINRRTAFDQSLIVVFVVLNFKIILYDSEFFRYKRETVKKNKGIKTELINYLEELSLNDALMTRKTVSEFNYQKYISFHKYSINSQNLSPSRLLQSNLMHFNFIYDFLVDWQTRRIQKATLQLFEKCRKYQSENVFLLCLVLAEKYQNLVSSEFDFLEILCGNFDSIVATCRKIESTRETLISKKVDRVSQFNGIVDSVVSEFLTKPNAMEVLIPKYEEIRNREKKKTDIYINENLDIERGSSPIKEAVFVKKPTFSDGVGNIKDLLDKTQSFFINSGFFQNSNENFAPTTFEFWVSKKSLVRIHNYKYSYMLDKFGRISVNWGSFIFVLGLIFSSYIEYFLSVILLWLGPDELRTSSVASCHISDIHDPAGTHAPIPVQKMAAVAHFYYTSGGLPDIPVHDGHQ
jgi:hypothetical protein